MFALQIAHSKVISTTFCALSQGNHVLFTALVIIKIMFSILKGYFIFAIV